MGVRRLVLAGSVLVLLSCGSDAARTASTASSPVPDAEAWVAGHLPSGFEIVSAEDRGGVRRAGYAPQSTTGCAYCDREYEIAIQVSSPTVARPPRGRDPRPVQVRGHDGTLSTLTDEGQAYGFEVVWDERSDLRLAVEGSNGPSEADTLAVANDVRGISEADWQRLLRELSLDTHVGRVDPTATAVNVVRGEAGSTDYVLTALVPGDFPLGPEDRRLDCFRLSYGGVRTTDQCPGHPIWARVGGQLFVFGDLSNGVEQLRVSPSYGSSFAAFTVDTVAAPYGPATRFYVAALPEGACEVSVDDASGQRRGPGTTGPLTESADDYSRCLPLMNASTPGASGPPTTLSSSN